MLFKPLERGDETTKNKISALIVETDESRNPFITQFTDLSLISPYIFNFPLKMKMTQIKLFRKGLFLKIFSPRNNQHQRAFADNSLRFDFSGPNNNCDLA